MQLHAWNKKNQLIDANQADKGLIYSCPECSGRVRVRSGPLRRAHFYHADSTEDRSCRQEGKGMEHLQTQLFLRELIGPSCELEKRFPYIGRIADVAWPAERLIFEVQYSPMTPDELLERNQDYRSQDYEVIWIFHDHRYNRPKWTEVEIAAQSGLFFYTNIDEWGRGWIYDQVDAIRGRQRIFLLPPLGVHLGNIRKEVRESLRIAPRELRKRYAQRLPIFEGDWMSDIKNSEVKQAALWEQIQERGTFSLKQTIFSTIRDYWCSLLERSSCS